MAVTRGGGRAAVGIGGRSSERRRRPSATARRPARPRPCPAGPRRGGPPASGAGNRTAALVSVPFMAPASLASSTSRDSRSASLLDLGGGEGRPSSNPPLMTSSGLAFARVAQPLAASTGSPLMKAIAVGPAKARRAPRHRLRPPPASPACSSRPRTCVAAQRPTQLVSCAMSTAVLGEHRRRRLLEPLGDLSDRRGLLLVRHVPPLSYSGRARPEAAPPVPCRDRRGQPRPAPARRVAIFLVSFAAGIVSARSFGQRGGYPVDAAREMSGFGAANIAAGLFAAFPVTASDSRTAINASVGGRSQIAGVVAALVLVVAIVFLGPALAILPIPALGAILIAAAISLIDVAALREIWRISRIEFVFAMIALVGADQPRGAERRPDRHRRHLRLPAARDDVPARRAPRPRPRPRRLLQAPPPPRRPARPRPRHRADRGRPALLQRRPRPRPAARHRRRRAGRHPLAPPRRQRDRPDRLAPPPPCSRRSAPTSPPRGIRFGLAELNAEVREPARPRRPPRRRSAPT